MSDIIPKPIDLWVRVPEMIDPFGLKSNAERVEDGLIEHWLRTCFAYVLGSDVNVIIKQRIGRECHITVTGFRAGTRLQFGRVLKDWGIDQIDAPKGEQATDEYFVPPLTPGEGPPEQ